MIILKWLLPKVCMSIFGVDDVAFALMASSAIGAGSSLIGGSMQASGQEETNALSIQEAQKNRDFQEMMYQNRHTFEVQDLKNAGLNPILSANSAASAPMGSVATVDNPEAGFGQIGANTGKDIADLPMNLVDMKNKQLTGNILSAQARESDAKADMAEMDRDTAKKVIPYKGVGVADSWTSKVLNKLQAVSESLGGLFHASASATAK